MRSERLRNIIVGLTILVAMAVCMYGIVLLGKFPGYGRLSQYQVMLVAANANGIAVGSKVEFNGVYAGQVNSVQLSTDVAGKMVAKVGLAIDSRIRIPASTEAVLSRPQAVGNPYVELKATDAKDPLPQDGTAILHAEASDSGLIPKEVFQDIHDLKATLSTTANELTTVARDLHMLLVYAPPEAIEKADPNDPNRPRENASTVIVRLNRTIKSLEELLTDPKLQGQVRLAVQNIADASSQLKGMIEKINAAADNASGAIASAGTAITAVGNAANSISGAATRASSTLDTTQAEIAKVSQKLVEMLAQVEKTTRALGEGNGTTGKLINDPRLYEGLLDLSKSLQQTVGDLDFLLKKWKDEGVNLKLK